MSAFDSLIKPIFATVGAASITYHELRGVNVGICRECHSIADVRDHDECPHCGGDLDEKDVGCSGCGVGLHLPELEDGCCPDCGEPEPFSQPSET